MPDPRNPDYQLVEDDDVEGHGITSGRIQPPREEDGDVHGHSAPDPGPDEEDDVEAHMYVRPEDQSRPS